MSEVLEVSSVGGVGLCRYALTLLTRRAGLHCQDRLTLLDTGVGVSGSSVGLVSVDTSVGVLGGVGRCRGRVSECRARAQPT